MQIDDFEDLFWFMRIGRSVMIAKYRKDRLTNDGVKDISTKNSTWNNQFAVLESALGVLLILDREAVEAEVSIVILFAEIHELVGIRESVAKRE